MRRVVYSLTGFGVRLNNCDEYGWHRFEYQ